MVTYTSLFEIWMGCQFQPLCLISISPFQLKKTKTIGIQHQHTHHHKKIIQISVVKIHTNGAAWIFHHTSVTEHVITMFTYFIQQMIRMIFTLWYLVPLWCQLKLYRYQFVITSMQYMLLQIQRTYMYMVLHCTYFFMYI